MLRFESLVALRHLRHGRGQTLLTVAAVAVGVTVIIFISSLIYGILGHVTGQLTDMLPHVMVRARERTPAAAPPRAGPAPGGGAFFARVERQNEQQKRLENWRHAADVIRAVPRVEAVAPAVTGQAIARRGGRRLGVQVFGADPAALDRVTPVTRYLSSGYYQGLGAEEVVLSYEAAEELGVAAGDRVRLASDEGAAATFRVVGIYDLGQEQYLAYVTLRAGQSLFGTRNAVDSLLVRTDDLYGADAVADRLAALLPGLEPDPWTRRFPEFVSSLGGYKATALLVSGFSLVASGFAIASVLIVSVVQKARQIGILKSLGATRPQILTIFLLEGLGIAVVGGVAGALLGAGVVHGLGYFRQAPRHPGVPAEPLFPSDLSAALVGAAVASAIAATMIAALLPARQASGLDPVEVMR